MEFTKIQGTGNDFIVIDDRKNIFQGRESGLARTICDRHFGVGADGILLIRKSSAAFVKMVIINSDGSYAAMCGNGVRCFAKYVFDSGISKNNPLKIETGDGVKEAFLNLKDGFVESVTINMGMPSFDPKKIPADCDGEIIDKTLKVNNHQYNITSMLMGVPHTMIFGNLENYDVQEGKFIEKYRLFPEGTNVNFCEIVDRTNVKVKTWERGAGATLACGTGCCASVVAANRLGFTSKNVRVRVPGGEIFVDIKDKGIFMTGPAVVSFRGEFEI